VPALPSTEMALQGNPTQRTFDPAGKFTLNITIPDAKMKALLIYFDEFIDFFKKSIDKVNILC
jgi:hypothetical protein